LSNQISLKVDSRVTGVPNTFGILPKAHPEANSHFMHIKTKRANLVKKICPFEKNDIIKNFGPLIFTLNTNQRYFFT
jgi:hypothetical protein